MSACNHYTSRKAFKYLHGARPTSCQSFWENNCTEKEDNKVHIYYSAHSTSITAPTDYALKLKRGLLLLPLLHLTHHPQSQESPLHIVKMSLPSNEHITVWLQLLSLPSNYTDLLTSPYHHLQHLINAPTNPIPCLKTQQQELMACPALVAARLLDIKLEKSWQGIGMPRAWPIPLVLGSFITILGS